MRQTGVLHNMVSKQAACELKPSQQQLAPSKPHPSSPQATNINVYGLLLKIKWDQVREQQRKNSWVRRLFCNIPNIEAFIERRMVCYIGNIVALPDNALPKQFFGTWINQPRKIGHLQMSCNNNFANTLKKRYCCHIKSREDIFKKWLKITKLQWK